MTDEIPHPSDFHIPTPAELAIMRMETGLSKYELAERADVAVTTIRRIENNNDQVQGDGDANPTILTVVKLLSVLDEEWPDASRD